MKLVTGTKTSFIVESMESCLAWMAKRLSACSLSDTFMRVVSVGNGSFAGSSPAIIALSGRPAGISLSFPELYLVSDV